MYEGCSKCGKKLQNGACPNDGNMSSTKKITAKLEIEYEQDGPQDAQVQAFTKEMNVLLGKDSNEFEDGKAYEEEFSLSCPIKIKFILKKDSDGKNIIEQCTIIKRVNPFADENDD